MVSRLTHLPLHDLNCGFKAYRAEVLRDIRLYGELHRYIPVLAHAKGYRITEIPVTHHPRRQGRSKFGWERLARGFLDLHTVLLLTKYATRPLHFFGATGILASMAGLGINGYLAMLWFLGHRPIGNRPLLMLGILLMISGIQLISLGLLGEMIINRDRDRETDYSIGEQLD